MLRKLFYVAILLSILFCMGCFGEPKLDTSSEQAFVKSIAKIYENLPNTDKAVFGKYLTAAMFGEINSFNSRAEKIKEGEYGELYLLINSVAGEKASQYFNAVNGLTATQIQEKGKAIWAEAEAKALDARKKFFDPSDFKKQYEGYK